MSHPIERSVNFLLISASDHRAGLGVSSQHSLSLVYQRLTMRAGANTTRKRSTISFSSLCLSVCLSLLAHASSSLSPLSILSRDHQQQLCYPPHELLSTPAALIHTTRYREKKKQTHKASKGRRVLFSFHSGKQNAGRSPRLPCTHEYTRLLRDAPGSARVGISACHALLCPPPTGFPCLLIARPASARSQPDS